MKIGVQLPEVERVVRWPEVRRMAVLAEQVGFDSLWVGDHYLYRSASSGEARGPWEAWTQLAAIAAVTERIEIGPLVAALPFHNPAVLAKMASTIDEISGGRLTFGVGSGWNQVEFRAMGLPLERRVARFEESFHIIRRLLAGETVTLHGDFYDLEECVLQPTSRRNRPVHLMIGSMGPRMLDITLAHVDAWNVWFTEFENRPEKIPGVLERLSQACDRVGRDLSTIEKSVAVLFDFGSSAPRQNGANPISGTVTEMADALGAIARTGIDHVQLVLNPITEATIDQAAEVVAAFRA
jgi:alkanesulfonate monooxygenase SsuD/methylene tetrahydromethanopterin reductase-like flavin-dependent oxidoreductase (luciferase family)